MASVDQDDIEKLLEEAGDSYKTCMQPGLGFEKTVQLYNETSSKYDKFVGAFGYQGPQKVASAMEELYPDVTRREQIRVLDIAAGTGLVGQELHKAGFRDLTALDPSPGMLEMAAKKGVYKQFFTECVDDKKLPIDENTYDAIVICGGMAENCIPCCALNEMIRIVQPGGFIVNVTCEEHVRESDMYRHLDLTMNRLERDGKWKKLKGEVFPDCLKQDSRLGLIFIHQVL